ncbi:ribonuclease T2 [Sphingobium sp. CFD-1]|uniref:ribonuclease T2 n=1 Tax=Sphingobium sp. CFD-1 TaxID=2878545 RepID=UPI00214B66B8|nr:ribonuclease T2 [Sphingobium sp. CFD-1]
MLRVALALLAFLVPGMALAQAVQCSPPAQMPRPRPVQPGTGEAGRIMPIGSYTLALSWSPQYCSTARGSDSAFQCKGRNGRFGFVLHGLWPDGVGRTWPQFCRKADLLPREVIRQNLCMTPSAQLLQHEWAKHGTCMASKPELYFDLARAFYQSMRFPDMAALARRDNLTVGQFTDAFVRANRRLRPDMIRVRTTRGNWLSEIWICMDRALEFARCPAGKDGAKGAAYLRIEPGPAMPRPSPARQAPVTPARKPGLILNLDPNTQPLKNGGR